MTPKILLCLQYWAGDEARARALTDLWRLTPNGGIADVLLVSRYDLPTADGNWLASLAPWAPRVLSAQAQRKGSGWPAGCNLLAWSAVDIASEICKMTGYSAVWFLEADSVPIHPHWLQRTAERWAAASPDVMGAYMHGPDVRAGAHINGNMMLRGDWGFLRRVSEYFGAIPELESNPRKAWDVEIWPMLGLHLWADLPSMFNCHGSRTIDPGAVSCWRGRGIDIIHGVKDESCLNAAREYLSSANN